MLDAEGISDFSNLEDQDEKAENINGSDKDEDIDQDVRVENGKSQEDEEDDIFDNCNSDEGLEEKRFLGPISMAKKPVRETW